MDSCVTERECRSDSQSYQHSTAWPAETSSILEAAQLKAALLSEGVQLTQSAVNLLATGEWKAPRMVRSGMSGGLEFYLVFGREKIAVSCAAAGPSSGKSPFLLADSGKGLVLLLSAAHKKWQVELLQEPSFYRKRTATGKEMASIVQQCFSKLAVGVFGTCSFSLKPETACAFCAIRSTVDTDAPAKTDADILETLEAAYFSEIASSIETIMLGGGTPAQSDHGAERFAGLAKAIRERFPKWQVTVMMSPPDEDDSFSLMKTAGVRDISLNLEFFSQKAFDHFTPGKSRLISQKRYKESLLSAVRIFGRSHVQSLLVVGLEPYEYTLDGVEWLAKHGVVPVLSPFRPFPSTPLASCQAPPADKLCEVYIESRKIVRHYDMFLGPKCIPCQCNTMSLPWDSPLHTT